MPCSSLKKGYHVAIITGGYTEAVQIRFSRLGITAGMKSAAKSPRLPGFSGKDWSAARRGYGAGDDIPDYEVMTMVGLPVAPADAAPEIKRIAKYISHKNGSWRLPAM